MDALEADMPPIASNYTTDTATLHTLQTKQRQLTSRITTFNERTKGIHDTTMKLRYAYSSADGLKEKMASVETLMGGLQNRIQRLLGRVDAVEKLRMRATLERSYRMRWMGMTGAVLVLGLALAFFYTR
jgi:hypothetical protein